MKVRYAVLLLICLLSELASAQKVDEIFNGFFNKTGGINARKNVNSLRITGTAPSPRGEFPITLYTKRPNFLKVVLDINGEHYIAQAFDGSVAWVWNPFQGDKKAEKLPEPDATDIANDANFDDSYMFTKFITYREKGYRATLEGKEKIEGHNCFKIKLTKNKTNKTDIDEYYYFDTETNLLNRYTLAGMTTDNEKWEKHFYFDDYREVRGGIKLPFYQEVRLNDRVLRKLVAENIAVNENIDNEMFAYPE